MTDVIKIGITCGGRELCPGRAVISGFEYSVAAPPTPESIPSAVVMKGSAEEDANASFAFPQMERGDTPAPDEAA